ncbi:MAG TPA: nitroreductase/quinone reductase family protein [Candidatus Eisenbacteria bacterium]|nr:nitroreductase/quinone reductase family protein [Candidatus Eisenbacteria bacterium]
MTFEEADLAGIGAAEEIEIETRSADGQIHRTIIWAVVHHRAVLIRSVRGPRGRWYREALADPGVAVHVGGRRIPATAVSASDPATIAACSEELRLKYRGRSLESMLRPETLGTTLRLEPA